VPGGFGENLTTLGFDEDGVCIGDILRIGSVTAQVTQPRQPCFKRGLRFAKMQMLRARPTRDTVAGISACSSPGWSRLERRLRR